MSQICLSDAEHAGRRKKTRRAVFLAKMELGGRCSKSSSRTTWWSAADAGPIGIEAMLRVHLMQNWFALGDLALEDAFSPSRARGLSRFPMRRRS